MEPTVQHLEGEGYSAHNKIPTIKGLLKSQNDQQDALLSARSTTVKEDKRDGKQEKEEMMEKANAHKENPVKNFEAKGEREVQDPVTLETIVIKDADIKDFKESTETSDLDVTKKALDPESSVSGPATNSPSLGSTQHIAPKISPGNILIHEFPASIEKNSLKTITGSLANYSYGIMTSLVVLWSIVAFGNGFVAFCFRTSIFVGLIVGVYCTFGIIGRKIEKELDRIRLQMIKSRGETFSPPTPESVEWMNAFLSTIWPLINPEMFTAIVDMVEDVMQSSLPAFVDAVKVNDFNLGKNSIRIVSMRALPDRPSDKEYPRQDWIDKGDLTVRNDEQQQVVDGEKSGESDVDTDQTGDYVNYEISFYYAAPPGTRRIENSNISLVLEFFLGVYDWIHIPLPIFIAVESIVGTVRLRIQLVPQSPFVRNVTFTLCGVPSIEASAIPLTSKLPNVLDLPIISGFVQSAIAAAASAYCAPKSITMNISQMISGDGIKKDTKALGILKVRIRHAVGLSAQDSNGFSDPYIVLSYAKFGKPIFSTRIIPRDLNPVFEQTAFIIVSDDEVNAKEQLSVQLWDSDATSADDLIGRIHVDLNELMLEPNVTKEREDTLMGFEDADAMSGKLSWEVTYYDKAPLNASLKKEEGINHSLPVELQERPELKVETKAVDTDEETDVRRTPPDPKFPSGVLSIIVHQINNLECQNLAGKSGDNREGQAGQDTDNASEASGNLPSAYCEILVNDDMIYKTRVKQYSSNPYYEAGTEVFLRDWTHTRLSVVVRDARLREQDPILGIVDLDLEEIFASSSQVTRLYALRDGVGFGRVNISVLFKGIQIDLPPNERGWDTATVVASSVRVEPVENTTFDFKEKKLTLSTLEAKQKLPAASANLDSTGNLEWTIDSHIRLPTYDRYSSALYFDYGGSSLAVGPLGTKVEAFATVWLSELVDDEPQEVRVPIVTGKNLKTLRQAYLNDQAQSTHEYEIVGWLIATIELDSGLDADHEQYSNTQTSRHEFEAYDRIEGQAQAAVLNSHADDDGIIDKEEGRNIAKAHKKALENRGRGSNQYQIVRTGRWTRQGIKDRLRLVKDKLTGGSERAETVATEAS